MRALPQVGPFAWLARQLPPWLVALLGGGVIGTSLLRIEPPEVLANPYYESAPRAANHNQAAYETGTEKISTDLFMMPTTAALSALFSPAEPIKASSGFEVPVSSVTEP